LSSKTLARKWKRLSSFVAMSWYDAPKLWMSQGPWPCPHSPTFPTRLSYCWDFHWNFVLCLWMHQKLREAAWNPIQLQDDHEYIWDQRLSWLRSSKLLRTMYCTETVVELILIYLFLFLNASMYALRYLWKMKNRLCKQLCLLFSRPSWK
jgi:hypothetical protein